MYFNKLITECIIICKIFVDNYKQNKGNCIIFRRTLNFPIDGKSSPNKVTHLKLKERWKTSRTDSDNNLVFRKTGPAKYFFPKTSQTNEVTYPCLVIKTFQ